MTSVLAWSQPTDFFAQKKNYYNLFTNVEKTRLDTAFTIKTKTVSNPKIEKYTNKANYYTKLSKLPLSPKKIKRYEKKAYKYNLKSAKILIPLLSQQIDANRVIKNIYNQKITNIPPQDSCIAKGLAQDMKKYIDSAEFYRKIIAKNPVENLVNLQNFYFFDNKVILWQEYHLAVVAKDSAIYPIFRNKYCKKTETPTPPSVKFTYDPQKDSLLFSPKYPKLDFIIKYTPTEQISIAQHPIDGQKANEILQQSLKITDTINDYNKKAESTIDPFEKATYIKQRNVFVKKQNSLLNEAYQRYFLTNRNYLLLRSGHLYDYEEIDSTKYKNPNTLRFLELSDLYYTTGQKIFDSVARDSTKISPTTLWLANKLIINSLEYQENFFAYILGLDTFVVTPVIKLKIPAKVQTKEQPKIPKDTISKKVTNTQNKKTTPSHQLEGLYVYNYNYPTPTLVKEEYQTHYKIYIGQTPYLLPVNELKEFGNIYFETFTNTKNKYFYVGFYKTKEEAQKDLQTLKKRGYPVKLVKFSNNRRTNVEVVEEKYTLVNNIININQLKTCYLIQIGTFSTPKTFRDFEKLNELYYTKLNDGRFKYFTAKTISYQQAENKLKEIKKLGYNDAVIVKIENGKLVEKFTPQETTSKEKFFRVQVGAFSQKLDDKKFNEYFANLKNYKISIYQKDSKYIYTVGNTTDYYEALNTLEQVKKLGYKDAFIQAFENDRPIPLSQALK